VKIHNVEFLGAVANAGAPPPSKLPQIAFSGRSNVGKSSLINRLLGRTRSPIARVSATPGKTQEINFYHVTGVDAEERPIEFVLVDLPGYGFARVPQEIRGLWKPLIEGYLQRTAELKGVVQLVDARHGLTVDDEKMVDYLARLNLPTLFVLTKTDKLKREDLTRRVAHTLETLRADEDQVIPFSAVNGAGRDDLLDSLEALLLDPGETT
jgi:GTP-binding protein